MQIDSQWGEDLTAGEDLAVGDNVCIKSDGQVYKADADDADRRPCIGAVNVAVDEDAAVTIITKGVRNDGSTLTKGAPVYLSTTAGAETQTGDTGKQVLGVALGASVWYFDPELSYNIPTA